MTKSELQTLLNDAQHQSEVKLREVVQLLGKEVGQLLDLLTPPAAPPEVLVGTIKPGDTVTLHGNDARAGHWVVHEKQGFGWFLVKNASETRRVSGTDIAAHEARS